MSGVLAQNPSRENTKSIDASVQEVAGLLDKPTTRLYCETSGRGTQVVRERSAKPLYVSSILTRASKLQLFPMQ